MRYMLRRDVALDIGRVTAAYCLGVGPVVKTGVSRRSSQSEDGYFKGTTGLPVGRHMVKIIGIDPGLSATGIGIVKGRGLAVNTYAFGTIRTAKEFSLPDRLHQIFSKLSDTLKREKPDYMVVEDVFSLNNYPASGILLGKVSGVILLAGHQAGVPVTEIPVREAKKILTGNGKASKEQLEKAVRQKLNLTTPIRPFHASDAVGLALIGLYRYRSA